MIRRMELEDIDGICHLHDLLVAQGAVEDIPLDRDAIAEYYSIINAHPNESMAYVNLTDGRVSGLITVNHEFSPHGVHLSLASVGAWLASSPTVGAKLLKRAQRWAKETGVNRLRIMTEHGQIQGCSWVMREGYSKVGTVYNLDIEESHGR